MLPTLFEFEVFGRTLAVNGYGLMIGIGLVLWTSLSAREAGRLGHERMANGATVTCLLAVVSIYGGGKLLYWITQIGADRSASGGAGEGFVFYGSLLATVPMMIWRLRSLGVPVLLGLDLLACFVPLVHGLGRIGCFLAGCCYGHRCDGPLAVTFTEGKGLNHVPLHPVQLYEAAGLFLLFGLCFFILRRAKRFDGQILFVYFIGYAVMRCVTEQFRGDPGRKFPFSDAVLAPGDPPVGPSTSVIISLMTALACIALLVWLRRRGHLDRLDGRRRVGGGSRG